MDSTTRGLVLMAFVSDGKGAIVYPDWQAGSVAASPFSGYNITAAEDDSSFFESGKDAIIYSITASRTDSAGAALLGRLSGEAIMSLSPGSTGGVGRSYTFGPNGIRIPGGFRFDSGSTASSWVIAYEVA